MTLIIRVFLSSDNPNKVQEAIDFFLNADNSNYGQYRLREVVAFMDGLMSLGLNGTNYVYERKLFL